MKTLGCVLVLSLCAGCATTHTNTTAAAIPHQLDEHANVGAYGGGPHQACGPKSPWGDVLNCGFDNPP